MIWNLQEIWLNIYMETKDNYFDNVNDFCEQCEKADELKEFNRQMFAQIDY